MELEQLSKLVTAHNRSRIERLRALAPVLQQPFFDLLALIFHSNDKVLPAHVENAPVGIKGYQPTEQLLANTKKYFVGFSHSHQAFINYPIEGIYLLNDTGALDYPKEACFDLWLVYQSSNTDEQTGLLKQKLQDVMVWAKTLGIKLNARLLNNSAILERTITSDELDRLYSSGIVLAGATPLWYYLNPEQETNYDEAVKTVTAALPKEVITLDFGPLTERDPTSLVAQAVEANLAAMHENLPRYLELLFQQVLLDQFPNNAWLADEYKKLLFANQTNSFYYDPNVLKLNLVSQHLPYELQLSAQRSLYLMSKERLSMSVSFPEHPWRRENLHELISSWQWHHTQIVNIDKRASASMRERLEEFDSTKKLTHEFNKAIGLFIQQYAPDAANKRVTLQKTFEDVFDTAPGIIPTLPDSLIPETAESQLFLHYNSINQKWLIDDTDTSQAKPEESHKPLYSSPSLIQTLAWGIINGALSKYTQVKLTANNGVISTEGIHALINYLHKSPLGSIEAAMMDLTWLMFANMHDTPKEAYKQQDVKLSLYQRDPLNYGYHRRNMVLNVEVLTYQKGKKWHYFKFDGLSATSEALSNLIRWQTQSNQSNFIDSWCPTINFSGSIIKRLNVLALDVCGHFQRSMNNGTYIFEVADRNAHIHWQEGTVEQVVNPLAHDLSDTLAQPRSEYSVTHIDQQLDREGLFSLLLQTRHSNQIRVYINPQKAYIDVFVIDELGLLFKQTYQGLREHTLINNFNEFLSEVSQLNNLEQLKFYKLTKNDLQWSTLPIVIESAETTTSYLPVKVYLEDASTKSECTISCGPNRFKGKANDPQLFNQVYKLVTKLRSSNVNYPLYISSINFPEHKQFSTYDYVTFKKRLERVLNLK